MTDRSACPVTRSVYEWRPFASLNTADYMEQLAALRSEEFSRIYLSLMNYPGILSALSADAHAVTSYSRQLTSFLHNVHALGFTVTALGGDPSWVNAPTRVMNTELLRYVIDYNRSAAHRVKLDGIQFDNEPWSAPECGESYASQVTRYLDTIAHVLGHPGLRTARNGFSIGFTVPFSYTNMHAGIAEVPYEGESKYAAYHALDLLNARRGSHLAFLDYRDAVGGPNGSIALARELLLYARASAPNVGVLIAQEVTDVEPRSITFYGKGYGALNGALADLASAFGDNPQLQGFAINDAQGLTALLSPVG